MDHPADKHGRLEVTLGDGGTVTRIGPYRIISKLGEGGMGEVYEAEQEAPVRRRVALKVIKSGLDSKQIVARFESERQALALMDHPDIARVFDAGVTEAGLPFFVMEFFAGEPISEFCDRHSLPTRRRLQLMIVVCDALQHAHRKGVIHRDIKPNNVLVRMDDGQPVVKVIDFGVAKATADPLTDRTLMTEVGQLVGTPSYMSPEQADPSTLDIDTRADVYSLGVLLYELLVGHLPFEVKGVGIRETLRRICEDEPPRPSARFTSLDATGSTQSASHRGTPAAALARELRGDLDWITLKALEKDRERRYGSAVELAADLRRHLADEPVWARPPSTVYRLRKLVRRNKVAAAGLIAVLIALAAGAITSTVAFVRAERQAKIARAVNDFLTGDLLAGASPEHSPDPDVRMRTVLDAAAARIQDRFRNEPLVAAAIRRTLGKTYTSLGLYELAEPHIEAALALQLAHAAADDRDTLASRRQLGVLRLLQGRHDDAQRVLRETAAALTAAFGPDDPDALEVSADLALTCLEQDRLDEAESLLADTARRARAALGDDHLTTLQVEGHLARLYDDQRRFDEAEKLYSVVIAAQKRSLGADHPLTLATQCNLALVYHGLARSAEAAELGLSTLDAQRRVLGDEHQETLNSINNQAIYYRALGRFAEAETLYRQDLETSRRILGEEHPSTLISMFNIGRFYNELLRFDEAEQVLAASSALANKILPAEHFARGYHLLAYGESLVGLERYRDAVQPLLQAQSLLAARFPDGDPSLTLAIANLVKVYDNLGDAEQAARWRGKSTGR